MKRETNSFVLGHENYKQMHFEQNKNMLRGRGAQWANFRGQVEIILGLVSDNHLHLHVIFSSQHTY